MILKKKHRIYSFYRNSEESSHVVHEMSSTDSIHASRKCTDYFPFQIIIKRIKLKRIIIVQYARIAIN